MWDFSNRVALITGASGSLGSTVARHYINSNAKVVLIDLSKEHIAAQFPKINETPERYLLQEADITESASMEKVVGETREKFGGIDILVNTVGGYRAGEPLYKTTLDTFEFMLNLNARSVFVTCKAVIPTMVERKYGKIINIGARPGMKGRGDAAAYSAAKSAVIRLTESMSEEMKLLGINVNCVIPGTIDTPQNRKAMPDADFNRWVSPDAIAEVILFLTSDAAEAIHGATIPVFGLT